eukprot:COSAG05_NODE_266_length_12619_cov_81.601677_9_plen_913_part_00
MKPVLPVCADLATDNVLVCEANRHGEIRIKLSDYGLHHTLEGGELAPLHTSTANYLAPERVTAGPRSTVGTSVSELEVSPARMQREQRSDVWSAGIVLVEVIEGSLPAPLGRQESAIDVVRGVLTIARLRLEIASSSVVGTCNKELSLPPRSCWPTSAIGRFSSVAEPLRRLIEGCLEPEVDCRCDAAQLLSRLQIAITSAVSTSPAAVHAGGSSSASVSFGSKSSSRCVNEPLPLIAPPPPVPFDGGGSCSGGDDTLRIGDTGDDDIYDRKQPVHRHTSKQQELLWQLKEDFFEWRSFSAHDLEREYAEPLTVASVAPSPGWGTAMAKGGRDILGVDALISAALNMAIALTAGHAGEAAGTTPTWPIDTFPMLSLRTLPYTQSMASDASVEAGCDVDESVTPLPAMLFSRQCGEAEMVETAIDVSLRDHQSMNPRMHSHGATTDGAVDASGSAVSNSSSSSAHAGLTTRTKRFVAKGVTSGETATAGDQRHRQEWQAAIAPIELADRRLSIKRSHHPVWDALSPPEQQAMRVAAVANAKLPVDLRERHIGYQQARIAQFRSILNRLPGSRLDLLREAAMDVPPVLRSQVWPLLLGIEDTESASWRGPVDGSVAVKGKGHIANNDGATGDGVLSRETIKQLAADVPRCHQYHPIMASAEGQLCLRRTLEGWLRAHPEYSYWQGIDSLAAPFVVMHFHRARRVAAINTGARAELMATLVGVGSQSAVVTVAAVNSSDSESWLHPAVNAARNCLDAWTRLHLCGMFGPGGIGLLRERLSNLAALLRQHLPRLSAHFEALNVSPELYAVPWVLTLFAHVLPISSTLQVWDSFLVFSQAAQHSTGNRRAPVSDLVLCMAVGILSQFESELLELDFDGLLLYLCRLPPINCHEALLWAHEHVGKEVEKSERVNRGAE